MVAMAAFSIQAATKYQINVGNVEVTSDNKDNVKGGDIKYYTHDGTVTSTQYYDAYVKYDPSTNTLTLRNIYISREGSGKYGVHNRDCSGLKIIFEGYNCYINSYDAPALKLEKSTTLENGYTKTVISSSHKSAIEMGSYSYYIQGSNAQEFTVKTLGTDSPDCLHGNGTGSTTVYFRGAKVIIQSAYGYGLNSFKANFEKNSDVTIKANSKKASVNNVSMSFYTSGGKIPAVLSPYRAEYSSSSNTIIYYTTGGAINDQDIYISDQYAVILNSNYFPNVNFRDVLYSRYFHKGYLTDSDISSFTSLDVSSTGVTDLTGINYFTALTYLNCSNTNLTSFNISKLSNLKTLNCANCKLTALDVSGNGQLQYLYANGNKITSLSNINSSNTKLVEVDLSGSSNNFGTFQAVSFSYLKSVKLQYCPIATVSIRYCPQLTTVDFMYAGYNNGNYASVYVHDNSNLTSLLVKSANIKILDCRNNKLSSLDLSGGTTNHLEELYCGSNQLTSLSGPMPNLKTLECYGNKLTSLDLTNYFTKLETLSCYNNQLTSLNMSGCPSLKTLWCDDNQLTSLSNLPNSIQSINCKNNKFTSLTITGKGALYELYCQNNASLTSLTASGNALVRLYASQCPALQTVDCSSNQLVNGSSSGLDLYSSDNVTTLYCSNNKFTSLNLTSQTKLSLLDCHNNQLTSLSLPSSVTSVNCGNNKFTSLTITGRSALNTLDVSNNASLTSLSARDNALTSVNVSGCSALSELYLQHNNLASLSVQGCNKLRYLYITRNRINGNAMTALINSMRNIPETESEGLFGVIAKNSGSPEYNEITTEQVKAARAKRWMPKEAIVDSNGNTTWVDIPESSGVLGDLNGNGYVDVEDVNAAINILLKKKTMADYPGNGDMDGNGYIDVEDVNAMINIILKL